MRRWMIRWTRSIAWTLAVAFAVALSANCVTGAEMTDAQKACCVAMGHDCGAMAGGEDCCSHKSSRVSQGLIASKGVSLAAPDPLLVPFALLPAIPSSLIQHDLTQVAHAALRPRRTPTYLFLASLLV